MDDNRHAQGHEGDVVTPEGEGLRVRASPDVQTREDATAPPRPVLFAIGDIHGNYDALQSILGTLQSRHQIFTDSGMETLADHVTLVFTGDYVDRGPDAIKVLDYLARMKSKSDGRLVMLMGNHEAMALAALGAIRGFSRFDLDQSSRILSIYWNYMDNGGSEILIEIARIINLKEPYNRDKIAIIRALSKASPEGIAIARAFLEEFGRGGRAGDLLRSLEILHFHEVFGRTFLFSHGDIPRDSQNYGTRRNRMNLERLRQEFKTHVTSELDTRDWVSKYHTDLPGRDLLWSRHYTEKEFPRPGINPERDEVRAREICDACGVDYIVAGHTATRNGRIGTFGGRIFHIDVGMVFGGEPTALMVSDAGISSATADADELLVSF